MNRQLSRKERASKILEGCKDNELFLTEQDDRSLRVIKTTMRSEAILENDPQTKELMY